MPIDLNEQERMATVCCEGGWLFELVCAVSNIKRLVFWNKSNENVALLDSSSTRSIVSPCLEKLGRALKPANNELY